jgi:hypothetical protein
VSNALAYLGNSTYTADASLNGKIDEFRIYNHAFLPADVIASRNAGPTPLDLIGLDVNTVTGQVTLKNRYSTPLSFNYYKIESAGNMISTAGWTSLDQQNVDAIGPSEGESWDLLGAQSAKRLVESYLLHSSTLAAGASFDLGHALNTAVSIPGHDADLKFQFALEGGELRTGIVNYITPAPMSGDYNDDGKVDALDYTVWRNTLGTTLPAADGDGDGHVDEDDFKIWKFTYGNTGTPGGGGLATPEPAAIAHCLIAATLLVVGARRSF